MSIDRKLGTVEASEALIRDLYIDLRTKVNAWSKITCQTPQARMGYVGQHLVSVVTGFPGGKSGARGYDLVLGNGKHGEVKTCYRIDQLGSCNDCNAVVSSIEDICSNCGSQSITRKNDSKWLITIKNDNEFAAILDPQKYYFVLFEMVDITNPQNKDIEASIWEVDPRCKGFAFCMMDYYLNIRSRSESKAPFDMWPHSFKFMITKPFLIYKSVIKADGAIDTLVFPSKYNGYADALRPLSEYAQARTVTKDSIYYVIDKFGNMPSKNMTKSGLLNHLEVIRSKSGIPNQQLCDTFAEAIYLPRIQHIKDKIPMQIKMLFSELQ